MSLNLIENISVHAFTDESKLVAELLSQTSVYQAASRQIFDRAKNYVENIRSHNDDLSIESFLKEYSLTSYEGVAIMCLAEALLRIPDADTADELIFDKLSKGAWQKHFSNEANILLNASTFGLMVSGQIINLQKSKNEVNNAIGKVINKMSEPVIRKALKSAMKILGRKFVIGPNIDLALKKAAELQKQNYLFSFDMLGEGARTEAQAEQFYNSYINGITKIGESSKGKKSDFIYHNHNVSVKLSALHPRYEMLNKEQVLKELLPKLCKITALARDYGLWIAIDAEEANRLELSLHVFEALLKSKEFYGFNGIGFVLQAYQKRALATLEFLKQLAEETGRIIPVRLVKGAYWDSEVKHAQILGLPDYPVFTSKAHTDISYLVCAKTLFENLKYFYPQFATHNALTVASILEVSGENDVKDFEFQRLYGMGDAFYNEMVKTKPVRIYAPVGSYSELLPYLIRRILENGANTSFVNVVVNKSEPIGQILTNPIDKTIRQLQFGNVDESKKLKKPSEIYQPERINSPGKDFGYTEHLGQLQKYIKAFHKVKIKQSSIIAGKNYEEIDVELAIDAARKALPAWQEVKVEKRAELLNTLADALLENEDIILPLLISEANKTPNDAISELREAVDFCRYYAADAIKKFANPKICRGYTGEKSNLRYKGKGIFVCISPWNFPLAIFLGQITAALVSGNVVIAKPAPQTEKIAHLAITLAHKVGIPKTALQLVMNGSIEQGIKTGDALVSSPHVAGVAFTGSTNTAHRINQTLAKRSDRSVASIATLIAETGGQNCMLLDSSSLLEKAVDDIINSSFGAAGQRCSALRVLYVQDEVYKETLELIKGAVALLKVGVPFNDLATDVPPVIDQSAKAKLEKHIKKMSKSANLVAKGEITNTDSENYVAPHVFEISSISELESEVFGPVLHVIKYKKAKIDKIIDEINSTGYGLTFGIHSRIESFIDYVTARIHAGNIYINRSQIGAVVGTHPFGGMNLSGTGPKAGGPNYLKRFVHEVTITNNIAAIGGNLELIS